MRFRPAARAIEGRLVPAGQQPGRNLGMNAALLGKAGAGLEISRRRSWTSAMASHASVVVHGPPPSGDDDCRRPHSAVRARLHETT
jgi:hypothetical protein